jgi:hypothetical protein
MRRTARYTWTNHKTNTEIAKELNITPVLTEYRSTSEIGYNINRMLRNRLPKLVQNYTPRGRRNQGRPLKRLLGA